MTAALDAYVKRIVPIMTAISNPKLEDLSFLDDIEDLSFLDGLDVEPFLSDEEVFSNPDEVKREVLEGGVMCFDLETASAGPPEWKLDPNLGTIGCVIIGTTQGAHILRVPPSWMPKFLADATIRKIGFNLKFDLAFLLRYFGDFVVRNIHDLYLKELLISARRQGQRHDLATTLYRRRGIVIAKAIDHLTVDWAGQFTATMKGYCLDDVIELIPLDAELDRLLEETGQTRAAEIENNTVLATAYMGINGIGVDRTKWLGAVETWTERAQKLRIELDAYLPQPINWNAPLQVVAAINGLLEREAIAAGKSRVIEVHPPDGQGITETKVIGVYTPITSSKKASILSRVGDHPIFQTLLDYKGYEKRRTNWGIVPPKGGKKGEKKAAFVDRCIVPFRDAWRIFSSWWQMGADTCRFSSSDPNGQQFPKEKSFREMIIAREGNVLVSLDFVQIEVLVAAVFAKDRNLLKCFFDGTDTHKAAVNIVTGIPIDQIDDDQRQLGKAINFGLQFCGGAAMLVDYARINFGVKNFTLDQSKKALRAYFRQYQGLARKRQEAYDWSDRTKRAGVGEIRNMIGMRRIVTGPQIKPTIYLNTIIQSTAGYGIKCAMYRLMTQRMLRYLCAQIHDELLFEFPKDRAEELSELAKKCMIVGMRDVLGNVPIGVDVQIAESWAG